MKKYIAFTLMVLLLIQAGLPAYGVTTEATVTISSASAQVDDTVSLTVTVSAEQVRSMMIVPQYNQDCLQLLSGQWEISGDLQDDWSVETGDAVIAFEEPRNLNGGVFVLTFTVLKTSDTQVSCDVMIQTDSETIEPTVTAGQITALCNHDYGHSYYGDGSFYWQVCIHCGARSSSTPYLLGDVNGDTKVNMKDWNMLYDYLSEVEDLSELALLRADANRDDKVNMKDWNRLYDHLNEIDPLW